MLYRKHRHGVLAAAAISDMHRASSFYFAGAPAIAESFIEIILRPSDSRFNLLRPKGTHESFNVKPEIGGCYLGTEIAALRGVERRLDA
jgi:hypothetical protein